MDQILISYVLETTYKVFYLYYSCIDFKYKYYPNTFNSFGISIYWLWVYAIGDYSINASCA